MILSTHVIIYFVGMEKLEGRDSFKSHRSHNEGQFNNRNIEMHPHWVTMCSR
jgi:hypothetical protein